MSVFSIDRGSAEHLTKFGNAGDIAAALTIARFTDRTGIWSTAGAAAVSRCLGVGRPRAEALLDSLVSKHFIDPASHSAKRPGPKDGPSAARWKLRATSTKRVWLGAGIVDGVGKWRKPLATLAKMGTTEARALLYMTMHDDMGTWGGVAPYPTAFVDYDPASDFEADPCNGMALAAADKASLTTYNAMIKATGTDKDATFSAIANLEKAGFIYQVVTVVSDCDHSEGGAFYHLHTHAKHGHPLKGEESLAGRIANLQPGAFCDADGRFYKRFGYVLPSGINGRVAGIFRLRFREVNPKSTEARGAWAEVLERQRIAGEWIDQFAGKTVTDGKSLQESEL